MQCVTDFFLLAGFQTIINQRKPDCKHNRPKWSNWVYYFVSVNTTQ